METTHENSRFRNQLLEKTSVLNPSLLARLKPQFLPSATATVATDSGITLTHVKTEGVIPPSLLKIQEVDYFLNQLKIQPIDTQPLITIQNGNYGFLTELNKINQLSFFDSFNCVDKVAVTVNNARQELRKLLATVLQHHTLVDVFLCLSFANLLVMGELRLALALVRLWWGGHGNKPFGANTVCRVVTVFEPPYRPIFRATIKKSTLRKGTVIMTNQTHAQVASANRQFSQDYYSVSDFFTPQTDATANSSYDNAYALLTQAHATVIALASDGQDLKEGFSLSQEIICNLLWSIQTQLEMAKAALDHMVKADASDTLVGV